MKGVACGWGGGYPQKILRELPKYKTLSLPRNITYIRFFRCKSFKRFVHYKANDALLLYYEWELWNWSLKFYLSVIDWFFVIIWDIRIDFFVLEGGELKVSLRFI